MTIRSLNGDDAINQLANEAMYSTLLTLNNEEKLTKEEIEEFEKTHVAVFVVKENIGFKKWWNKIFGKDDSETNKGIVIVCKTYTEIK